MQRDPVADLAGHPAVVGVHGADEHRRPGLFRLAGAEEGSHQGEVVVVAVVGQPFARFPGVPDGVQRLDVFPDPRARRAPFGGETPLDMTLDLSAEAQPETASGIVLQVPGGVGHHHGRAGKGDGHPGLKAHPRGCGSRQHQRQHRVVRRILGAQAVIAHGLGPLGLLGDALQVAGCEVIQHPETHEPLPSLSVWCVTWR